MTNLTSLCFELKNTSLCSLSTTVCYRGKTNTCLWSDWIFIFTWYAFVTLLAHSITCSNMDCCWSNVTMWLMLQHYGYYHGSPSCQPGTRATEVPDLNLKLLSCYAGSIGSWLMDRYLTTPQCRLHIVFYYNDNLAVSVVTALPFPCEQQRSVGSVLHSIIFDMKHCQLAV